MLKITWIFLVSILLSGCLTIKEREALAEAERLAEIKASYAPDQVLYQYDQTKRIVLTESKKVDPCNTGYAYFENTEQGIKRKLNNIVLMGQNAVISIASDDKDTVIIPIEKQRRWCGRQGRCDSGPFILYSFDGGKTMNPLSWSSSSVFVPTFIVEKNKFYIIWQNSEYGEYISKTVDYRTCLSLWGEGCKDYGESRKFEVAEFTIDKNYRFNKEDNSRLENDLTSDKVNVSFLTDYKRYYIYIFNDPKQSKNPEINSSDAIKFPQKYYKLITQLGNRAVFAQCRVVNPILLN